MSVSSKTAARSARRSSVPLTPTPYSLKGEELAETAALMFGRRSYETFAPVWAGSEDHAAYKELPKYVVSSSLYDVER